MSRDTTRKAFRQHGCLAYQADFAADFLSEGAAQHHLLVTPSGLGKVRSVSLIAGRMVENGRARRILVIAPGAFARLWQTRLETCVKGVPVEFLHTRAFREAQKGRASAESPWPETIVAVVPGDAAVKEPLMPALLSGFWDLVVVAETRARLESPVSKLYEQLLLRNAVTRSIVIADRALPWTNGLLEVADERSQTAWPNFRVTDWFGDLAEPESRNASAPPVCWTVRDYCRNDAEVRFFRLIQGQLRKLRESRSPFHFYTNVLLRQAASSPLAAERTLDTIHRKFSRRLLHSSVTRPDGLYGDPAELEDLSNPSYTPATRTSYLDFLHSACDALEAVPVDTKLACFLQLIEELSEEEPGKICVLAAYADTLAYLRKSLLSVRVVSRVISRGFKCAERQRLMKEFVEGGDVLLATVGALGRESDLSRVKHVVLYDVAMTPHQLEQIQSRFRRANRARSCRMYALRDNSGIHVDPLFVEADEPDAMSVPGLAAAMAHAQANKAICR